MTILNFFRAALGGPVKMRAQEFRRDYPAGDVSSILLDLHSLLEQHMSALTDLQAAVNAVVAEIATLKSQLATVPPSSSVSDADAAALTATLDAAVNPPAVAPAASAAPATPAAPAEPAVAPASPPAA